MTFDYYDDQPHEMARDTETAAGHLLRTLPRSTRRSRPPSSGT